MTAGWRRMETDGEESDGSICHSATFWFSWSLVHFLPFWSAWRQMKGWKMGSGHRYSMASWFSWSALISSLASLPSLLLLLFLCLCRLWLSPSSLSCLLLLLLLMKGEENRREKKWSEEKGRCKEMGRKRRWKRDTDKKRLRSIQMKGEKKRNREERAKTTENEERNRGLDRAERWKENKVLKTFIFSGFVSWAILFLWYFDPHITHMTFLMTSANCLKILGGDCCCCKLWLQFTADFLIV